MKRIISILIGSHARRQTLSERVTFLIPRRTARNSHSTGRGLSRDHDAISHNNDIAITVRGLPGNLQTTYRTRSRLSFGLLAARFVPALSSSVLLSLSLSLSLQRLSVPSERRLIHTSPHCRCTYVAMGTPPPWPGYPCCGYTTPPWPGYAMGCATAIATGWHPTGWATATGCIGCA